MFGTRMLQSSQAPLDRLNSYPFPSQRLQSSFSTTRLPQRRIPPHIEACASLSSISSSSSNSPKVKSSGPASGRPGLIARHRGYGSCLRRQLPFQLFSPRPTSPSLAAPRSFQTSSTPAPVSRESVSMVAPASLGESDLESLRSCMLVVASIPACPYCKRAKEALSAANIPYMDVDVSGDADLRAAVKELSGRSTVPQIFINGSSIGGSDELLALMSDGKLDSQLEAAKAGGKSALPPSLMDLVARVVASAKASASAQAGSQQNRAELDGLAKQMAAATTGVLRGPVQDRGRTYQAFTASQAISWLIKSRGEGADSEEAAKQLLHDLQAANLIHPLDGNKFALVSEMPPVADMQALNTPFVWLGPARPAEQVANELRGLILELYDSYLSSDGKAVSYKGIRQDPRFKQYVAATAELQKVDISSLSRESLMAMFINLYNALIIHALVVRGSKMNTLQRTRFFTCNKYNIGGLEYSPDDMENGVLRGNRSPASNLFNLVGLPIFSTPIFRRGDPRAQKVVTPMDPRIHFALVCGAKSCPPIKLYTPDSLEEGLSAAGEAFCASEVVVDVTRREVKLSKIFSWYGVDFGSTEREKLAWILPFLSGTAKEELQRMLDDGGQLKVSYLPYDWDLNGED